MEQGQKNFPFQKMLIGDAKNAFDDSLSQQVDKSKPGFTRSRTSNGALAGDIKMSSARQGLDQHYCETCKEMEPEVFSFLGERTIYRVISKATPFFSSSILLVALEIFIIIFFCVSAFSLLCGLFALLFPRPNQLLMEMVSLFILSIMSYSAGLLLFLFCRFVALIFGILTGRLPGMIAGIFGVVFLILFLMYGLIFVLV